MLTELAQPNPWYVVIAGMASYLDAATIVSSGNALVMYQKPLEITGDQIGVLSFALLLKASFAVPFALLFLRIVDTRLRIPAFHFGAAAYVLSTLVPTLVGVNVSTLLVWQCLWGPSVGRSRSRPS